MSEWISVKDRLPEAYKNCLFSNGRYIDIGQRTGSGQLWCVAAHMMKSLPTHWMPLPKLPEMPNE